MARKKPLNIYPVKTLKDADDALEKISGLQRQVAAEELAMNEKINGIKAASEIKVAAFQKQIDALENGLQAFCEYGKEDLFKKKRSLDLVFGVIGFRKASKLSPMPKKTWARIVELMEQKGFISGVRIKKTANKEAMGEWSDEKLAKVGARRKQSDDFWYETKEEELKALEG